MMSRVDLFSSIWCDFQTRGFKDRSALLDWLWETSVPSRFCTICNVYNQEAYAHNISDNWVFTSLLILDSEIKNTHSLLMTTLHCRASVGCLCVLVFTVHNRAAITSHHPAPFHHHGLQSDSGCRKICYHSHRNHLYWGGKTGCFNYAPLQGPSLWQPASSGCCCAFSEQ